ncbi:50S ribosomal protein L29 [Candidatus Bipolaricaulota bacterium]|jgi:large subunit ribosomal protein L29
MKPAELRELTIDELAQKERELKRKVFNLRFQRATGELDASAELKKARRDVARVKTLLVEKTQEAGR